MFGKLRYGLNATGAIARRIGQNGMSEPLTVAPGFFGNARASYAIGGGLPTLAIAIHYLAKRPADRAFDAGYASSPYAPEQLELRATVLGPVPFVPGLSYRASFDRAFSDKAPYVIGPNQLHSVNAASGPQSEQRAELAPVDIMRVTFGLQYDFGGPK